jgi:CTP:molybdopterin cytidylyltransferase MocA
MSSFDGSKPPPPQRGARTGSNLPTSREALRSRLVALGHSERAREAARGARGSFAIALDATGSMGGLIDQAKDSIATIMNRVFKEAAARIRMQFLVYRDYDVAESVLERSALTEDSQELVRWLAQVRAFGGGANPGEAVNEALQAVYEGAQCDALIVAGDEPSLSRADLDRAGRRQHRSALELAEALGQRGVPVHTFVVGDRADTARDFAEIARRSGGQTGRLDGSQEMIDMAVMAMLARLKGAASVDAYMRQHRLAENAKRFGTLLLAPPKR